MMKQALVLIVENESNSGEFNKPEPLIDELKICVKSWRKFFPKLRIIAVCPSEKGLSSQIVDELNIEYYFLNIKSNHQCGYYNIPLGLAWAEKNLDLDYLIHTDLDMELLRSFELPGFNDERIYIGRLNDLEKKPFHLYDNIEFTFESNFIMAKTHHEFFRKWNEQTEIIFSEMGSQNHEFYPEAEEFAIDYIYQNFKDKYKIIPLIDYQIGTRYPLSNMANIDNVKFHHNHIYESKEEFVKWKLQTR